MLAWFYLFNFLLKANTHTPTHAHTHRFYLFSQVAALLIGINGNLTRYEGILPIDHNAQQRKLKKTLLHADDS